MHVGYSLAAIAVLTIAVVYLWRRNTTAIPITGAALAPNGSLSIIAVTSALPSDLTKLYGRRIIFASKSLGDVVTSVCDINSIFPEPIVPSLIKTAANARLAGQVYNFDPSDRILLPPW